MNPHTPAPRRAPARLGACFVLALAGLAPAAQAASVYLTPAAQSVPFSAGSASFDLSMNFAPGEATVGGGVDIALSGVATLVGFTPSSYFTSAADPAFSGYGKAHADHDLEIHFGSFGGLSGQNRLGTLTVGFTAPGQAAVGLAINSFYGAFYGSTTPTPLDVQLTGASLTVTSAVPEPQVAGLMLAGLGVLAGAARRVRRST